MSFVVINGVFAFLFSKLLFCIQFFPLFTFWDEEYHKYLRKVIKYTKNIHKVP